MNSSIDSFRPKIVETARSLLGKRFIALPDGTIGNDPTKITRGTDPRVGFDCSGLALRCIWDGLSITNPIAEWPIGMRTSQGMADAIYGERADIPMLDPKMVLPGDLIAWMESGIKVFHCAVATGVADSDGSIQYIHSTIGSGTGENNSVQADTLKPNGWSYPVHLPLGKLACAARLSKFLLN
jgi:hypothetical protein